jgi:hypothetical protein
MALGRLCPRVDDHVDDDDDDDDADDDVVVRDRCLPVCVDDDDADVLMFVPDG